MPLSSFIRLYYGNPLAELIYIFRTEPARGRRGHALSQSHRRGLRPAVIPFYLLFIFFLSLILRKRDKKKLIWR